MINGPRPRCAIGLGYDGMATRCYLPSGHSGPHKAKAKKSEPYVTIRWFSGDARSFLTTRSAAWAWKDVRKDKE